MVSQIKVSSEGVPGVLAEAAAMKHSHELRDACSATVAGQATLLHCYSAHPDLRSARLSRRPAVDRVAGREVAVEGASRKQDISANLLSSLVLTSASEQKVVHMSENPSTDD